MKRIKKLTELMDSPVDYNVTINSLNKFQAEFIINDAPYTVNIDRAIYRTSNNEYDITFFNRAITFDDSMGISGTGNAATVFSTVAAIVQEHFQRHKDTIETYTFSAKEPSRRKLYQRFADMIKKNLGFNKIETYTDDDELIFTIQR